MAVKIVRDFRKIATEFGEVSFAVLDFQSLTGMAIYRLLNGGALRRVWLERRE